MDAVCFSADDLRDYFEKFGKISDATVKTDPETGRSKGFGFVVFVDPSAVDQVELICCQPFTATSAVLISEPKMWESVMGFPEIMLRMK